MQFTIKQARIMRDLTQESIALLMGISTQKYRRFEKYEQEMPVTMALKFCKITGIGIDDIFFEF